MRKSKRDLVKIIAICLLMAIACGVFGFGIGLQTFIVLTLLFGGWLMLLNYRDHLLSQGNQVRQVRADYQRPPEVMSRGSRGLPTNFD